MSIDRLLTCPCGHSVNLHEGTGCQTYLERGPGAKRCACEMSRDAALERIIDTERIEIRDRWQKHQSGIRT